MERLIGRKLITSERSDPFFDALNNDGTLNDAVFATQTVRYPSWLLKIIGVGIFLFSATIICDGLSQKTDPACYPKTCGDGSELWNQISVIASFFLIGFLPIASIGIQKVYVHWFQETHLLGPVEEMPRPPKWANPTITVIILTICLLTSLTITSVTRAMLAGDHRCGRFVPDYCRPNVAASFVLTAAVFICVLVFFVGHIYYAQKSNSSIFEAFGPVLKPNIEPTMLNDVKPTWSPLT